jgi:hypothetical protein
MIGEATDPARILHVARPNYSQHAISASTSTVPYLPALNDLLTLENRNGYTFQACLRAHAHAEVYLEAATAILGDKFPAPEFVPDGEGGIDIEWSKNARRLTLSCRATEDQNDYIYSEENGVYDARDFTLALLITRLHWLNAA